jgi:hypothetical protein
VARTLILAGLVLALTASTAQTATSDGWEGNFRRCDITKASNDQEHDPWLSFEAEDLPKLEKWVAFLKVCDKFWQCVAERDGYVKPKGKRPKHCYVPRNIPDPFFGEKHEGTCDDQDTKCPL